MCSYFCNGYEKKKDFALIKLQKQMREFTENLLILAIDNSLYLNYF